MLLTPPLVTNCHTFSDPLPLERDILYGRPHVGLRLTIIVKINPIGVVCGW